MKKINNILFALSFIFSLMAYAQNSKEASKKQSKSSPKVIDFEAEIIEGERKTPTLFLQIGLEKPTMDAVLYQRKDFNDFHAVTKDRRPVYQVPNKK